MAILQLKKWKSVIGFLVKGDIRWSYTTGTESFDNLDPVGTQYHLYIAEKSVSQSLGQYKTSASCDGGHTYPGDTTAPNAAWSGYFNTYQSSVANAGASHPIFNTVQNLSITVDGNVFDDW